MASPRHPYRRASHRWKTAGLVVLVGVSVAQLPAGPAVAAETVAVPLVTGRGLASFEQGSPDALSGITGCQFSVDAQADEDVTTGTFRCRMSEEALSLGIPFVSLDGTVDGSSDIVERRGTLTGTARLLLPDGQVLEATPFVAQVRDGRESVGRLRLTLLGLFDDEPGDTKVGDGNYSQAGQDLFGGFIRVGPLPEPEPDPDPEPEPDPDPEPEPDPGPGGNQSGDPDGPGGDSSAPGYVRMDPGSANDGPFVLGGTNSTGRLMAILAELSTTGDPAPGDVLSVAGPFPVAGLAWWQDDWHAYRCCPYQHLHQGLDIFAPRGTPVVAAASGVISQKVTGSISGLGVEVTDAFGTQYFYAHLDGFAAGLDQGHRVQRGDVLGYVGSTGNARGTSTHVHFEVQPGGVPVPPKPYVDAWLILAEIQAEALVERLTGTEVEEPEGLAAWLNRAVLLEGDSSGELIGEASGSIEAAPVARRSPPVASGAMILFCAGMFLMLLVGPGVFGGRRQAARQLRLRPGIEHDPARFDRRRPASRRRAAR